MCSAFFSVRVKSLFLKKKSKTPAGGQRYKRQSQKRRLAALRASGQASGTKTKSNAPARCRRYEKQTQKHGHPCIEKIMTSRLARGFRVCLRHRPIDAPERPMEA